MFPCCRFEMFLLEIQSSKTDIRVCFNINLKCCQSEKLEQLIENFYVINILLPLSIKLSAFQLAEQLCCR